MKPYKFISVTLTSICLLLIMILIINNLRIREINEQAKDDIAAKIKVTVKYEIDTEIRAAKKDIAAVVNNTVEEDIAEVLKIAIEDEIWFRREGSSFYFFLDHELDFEYTYDEDSGTAYVLFTKDNIAYQEKEYKSYYFIVLHSNNGVFINEIGMYVGQPNYEDLKNQYLPDPEGVSSVVIDSIRKPGYNASEDQIQEATNNIMNAFKRNFLYEDCTDIYIRCFYDVSESTVIIYSIGERRYVANADISGRVYKPTPITDEDETLYDYAERLIESAYFVE